MVSRLPVLAPWADTCSRSGPGWRCQPLGGCLSSYHHPQEKQSEAERAPSANRAALKAHFLPVPVLSSAHSRIRFDGFGREKIKKSF